MSLAKKELLITIILSAFLMLPLVSAEIMVGQVNPLYGLGDKFDINIVAKPATMTNDFFTAELVCDSTNSVEIYKSPLVLDAKETKSIDISAVLDKALIGELNGICLIRSTYGGESQDSSIFVVSNNVNITVKTEKFVFDPEETIKISGIATKANGQKLDGFVDISLGGLNTTVSGSVAGGQFNLDLQIPQDAPAGKYHLITHAYERESSGQITNEGSESTDVEINSVGRSMDIAISSGTFVPGSEIVYTVLLYDQAGNEINNGNAAVKIYGTSKTLFAESLVKSGIQNILQISSNSTPGNWEIDAKATDVKNLTADKLFYIESFENVSYILKDYILTVENTGNIPYKKALEISIGDVKVIKEVELQVGEIKKYVLYAPEGTYNVDVRDGSRTSDLGFASLTGNAIAVRDFTEQEKINLTIIIWAIVIILLLFLAYYVYRRVVRKPYFGRVPKVFSTTPSLPARKPMSLNSLLNKSSGQNLIESGQRQECAIVTLKIRNLDDLQAAEAPAIQSINSALILAKQQKAKIYSDENYRLIIFSPMLTGQQDNNLLAMNMAKEIEKKLGESNRKFAKKVDFGISVSLGDLIVEKVQNSFKFGSMGSTIPIAKKISESSHNEVLVADNLYRKSAGKVRGEKLGNYWKLKDIRNNQMHSEFISRFLKKQGQNQ